jgi:hypothetical protein
MWYKIKNSFCSFALIPVMLVACASLMFASLCAQPIPRRVKYNFNSDWKVYSGDAKGAEASGLLRGKRYSFSFDITFCIGK